MTNKLLAGAAALNAAGSTNSLRRYFNTGLFQVNITGTLAVSLYGQSDPSAPLVLINTYTASTAEVVTLFPIMTAKVTSYTSGSADAWLTE